MKQAKVKEWRELYTCGMMQGRTKIKGTYYQMEMGCDVEGCDANEVFITNAPMETPGWHVVLLDGEMHRDVCDDCFESMLNKFKQPPAPNRLMQTWIGVIDETPKLGTKVIARCADGLIVEASMVESTGEPPHWEYLNGHRAEGHSAKITHWIPCPDLTKHTTHMSRFMKEQLADCEEVHVTVMPGQPPAPNPA